jgi:hypothetical protein
VKTRDLADMTKAARQPCIQFTVKVVPGSSRTLYCGMHDGMYKIRLAAPPEKGKANKALIDFLAGLLGVKKTAVAIVSGQTNPIKHIVVEGVDACHVAVCFNTVCPD